MSTAIQFKITRDTLSPALLKAAKAVANRRPILEAMGLAVAGMSARAFNDASLRPSPWAPKSGGGMATLKRSGTLWRSVRISGITNSSVTIGSDRKYAAIHQFGGTILPKSGGRLVFNIGGVTIFAKRVQIPARPFMPFTRTDFTEKAKRAIASAAERKLRSLTSP